MHDTSVRRCLARDAAALEDAVDGSIASFDDRLERFDRLRRPHAFAHRLRLVRPSADGLRRSG